MGLNKISQALYKTARLTRWIKAAQTGKILQRIFRVTIWRVVARLVQGMAR